MSSSQSLPSLQDELTFLQDAHTVKVRFSTPLTLLLSLTCTLKLVNRKKSMFVLPLSCYSIDTYSGRSYGPCSYCT